MRKVLLVHISSSGCCNTLVTMLNNGDFGFPYCATPVFSTPAVWCRVFQSRVFQFRVFSRPSCRENESIPSLYAISVKQLPYWPSSCTYPFIRVGRMVILVDIHNTHYFATCTGWAKTGPFYRAALNSGRLVARKVSVCQTRGL